MITKQQIANHYRKLHRQPPLAEWEPGEEEVEPEIETRSTSGMPCGRASTSIT